MSKLNKGPVLVTSALMIRGSEILIAQRKKESELEPSKWEFPGGKTEYGESPEESLRREILEELNLQISVQSLFHLTSHVYESAFKNVHVVVLFYICRVAGGEVQFLDVQDAKWVSILDLESYEFAAADLPVMQKLMSEQRPHLF